MAFPTTPSGSWTSDLGLPSRLFGTDRNEDGFELYEGENAFVLSVEMPGFDPEDIDLRWDDVRLYVAADHTDDDIEAEYTNGVLEVTIPITEGTAPGEAIPIES